MEDMMAYIGTKLVQAKPATKNGEPGYTVRYADGYESWSPAKAFEDAYRSMQALDFGGALTVLKMGGTVARQGWNGRDMFLFLVNGSHFTVNREPLLSILGEGTPVDYHAHIDMKTADGTIVPWLASQTDMLATDWAVVSLTAPGVDYRTRGGSPKSFADQVAELAHEAAQETLDEMTAEEQTGKYPPPPSDADFDANAVKQIKLILQGTADPDAVLKQVQEGAF